MSTSGATEESPAGLALHLYIIVLASACLHASWNFVIRSTKGNSGVVLSAYCINCPLLGLVCYWRYDIVADMNLGESWMYVVATGVIHAVYLIVVALAYRHGDMSIVYPVARGTGVAATAIFSVPLLGAQIAPGGLTGVSCVVLGIFVVGLQASCCAILKPRAAETRAVAVNGETQSVLAISKSNIESKCESQQTGSGMPNDRAATSARAHESSLGTSMVWAMVVASTIAGYA